MTLNKVFVVILKDDKGNVKKAYTFSELEDAANFKAAQTNTGAVCEMHITHLDSCAKKPAAVIVYPQSPFYEKVKW